MAEKKKSVAANAKDTVKAAASLAKRATLDPTADAEDARFMKSHMDYQKRGPGLAARVKDTIAGDKPIKKSKK